MTSTMLAVSALQFDVLTMCIQFTVLAPLAVSFASVAAVKIDIEPILSHVV